MLGSGTETVRHINELHGQTVARWHTEQVDNPYSGFLGIVCQQSQFNYLLWHEEDIARSRDVSDTRIAEVKRAIDGYNQNRNDWIEKIDDYLIEQLVEAQVPTADDAGLNTETPGSAIDRLSIMALRIYHMREQLERDDVDEQHRDSVNRKLALCLEQERDLSDSLAHLLDDIFAGRKRLKVYRQMKMYNDPTLNPHIYASQRRQVC